MRAEKVDELEWRPGRIQNPHQVSPVISPGKSTGLGGEVWEQVLSHLTLYFYIISFIAETTFSYNK